MPNDNNKKHNVLSPGLQYSFAAVSSCLEHSFMHPVDVAVHRWQNARNKDRSVQFHQAVFANNGAITLQQKLSLLYNGFLVSGFHKTLGRTFKYGSQPLVVAKFDEQFGEPIRAKFGDKAGNQLVAACAGAAVGVGETIFTPLDKFKIQRQFGFVGNFWQFLQLERWHSYSGIGPAIARNVPGSFALFFASNGVKDYFAKQNQDKNGNPDLSIGQHFAAASAGAVSAMVVTNPQEVVKTRVMAQQGKVSSLSIFRQTVATEGASTLWRGLFLRSVFAIPKLGIPLTLSFFLPEAYGRYQESTKSNSSTNRPK